MKTGQSRQCSRKGEMKSKLQLPAEVQMRMPKMTEQDMKSVSFTVI